MKIFSGKIFFLTLVIFFCILSTAHAQSTNATHKLKWRWSDDDSFCSTSGSGIISKYDKVEHFVGGIATYETCLLLYKGSKLRAFVLAVNLQIAWEIKDAFVPWEKYGWIGGEGFSWKDALCGIGGVFFAMLLNDIIDWIF